MVPSLLNRLLLEAHAIADEDRSMCRAIGRFGADLIAPGQGVLTHCNAGGLATADYGTALAVVFAAHEQGKNVRVIADETRPLASRGPPDRLGTRPPWHPGHAHLRQHGRPGHEGGQGSPRRRRGRPDRRQRRHRQQDRNLWRRPAGQGPRHPVLRRRSIEHIRPRDCRRNAPSRSSSATLVRSPTASADRPLRKASGSTIPPSM